MKKYSNSILNCDDENAISLLSTFLQHSNKAFTLNGVLEETFNGKEIPEDAKKEAMDHLLKSNVISDYKFGEEKIFILEPKYKQFF